MDMDIGYRNKVRYSNGPGKHAYVKGPNIKDVRWGKEVLAGTMKYFKNKLMGCEIYFFTKKFITFFFPIFFSNSLLNI